MKKYGTVNENLMQLGKRRKKDEQWGGVYLIGVKCFAFLLRGVELKFFPPPKKKQEN